MAGAQGSTSGASTTYSELQGQRDKLMSTLPDVFDMSELPSTEGLLKEIQDAGDVKSHSYSFSPSAQQLNLYWLSQTGDDGTKTSGGSTGHHGNHNGGNETTVGVACTGGDGVMSRPDQHWLEEERRLKAEVASLKEKLHKLSTLKLNENKTSASELEELTVRWRKAAQEVAEDISSCSQSMHEHPVTVGQLLNLLHIPHSLLHYSEEEESFID